MRLAEMQSSPPLFNPGGEEALAAAIRLRKVARVAEGGWPTKKLVPFTGWALSLSDVGG